MKERKKSKMSLKILLRKPHYKAILHLLMFIGEKESGLRQAHFRYALMQDHGLAEDTIKKITKGIFGDYMKTMEEHEERGTFMGFTFDNDTDQGCNYPRQKLTNYLTTLVDRGLIKKNGTRPNVRYKVTPELSAQFTKDGVVKKMECWGHNDILRIETDEFKDGDDELILFGFSKETLWSADNSPEDNKMISECINNILTNARKLMAYKNSKIRSKITEEDYYTKFLSSAKTGRETLKQLDKKTTFQLFYGGSRFPKRMAKYHGENYKVISMRKIEEADEKKKSLHGK